jgi:hypothetical protein
MEVSTPGALVIPTVDELREWIDRQLRCAVGSATRRCSDDARWRVRVACPTCGLRWTPLCDFDARQGDREDLAIEWSFVCRLHPGRPVLGLLDLVPPRPHWIARRPARRRAACRLAGGARVRPR